MLKSEIIINSLAWGGDRHTERKAVRSVARRVLDGMGLQILQRRHLPEPTRRAAERERQLRHRGQLALEHADVIALRV